MTAPEQDRTTWSTWRKSSFSGGSAGSNCVEVAFVVSSTIAVRDSKNPDGPHLEFPHPHWRRFVA